MTLLFLEKNYYDLTDTFNSWPSVTYADIYAYLIDYPSSFTHQSLKAYKALEAYKYVVSGLVSDVLVKQLKDNFLVMGKVRHGQSMFTKTPLRAWTYIKSNGEICYAHCTCMAGLGEACSHVAALVTEDCCLKGVNTDGT